MLLAIDCGNTNTLFAIHDGNDWVAHWRSGTDSTRTADEHAVWLSQLMALQGRKLQDITDCVISTVVPQALFNFRNLARRYFATEPLVVGEPGVELGAPIRIPRPEQVGADRLVAAIGAPSEVKRPLTGALISRSSRSKINVAPAGITPPAPRSPYPREAGRTSSHLSPGVMSCSASVRAAAGLWIFVRGEARFARQARRPRDCRLRLWATPTYATTR